MGDLAPPLIVFLVILGAVFATTMGYATHRVFGFKDEDLKKLSPSDEQEAYMRQVRKRNFSWLKRYCNSLGIQKPPVVSGRVSVFMVEGNDFVIAIA
jgi:hypothetical protein